jgi:predicted Zn-dependent protease
MLGESHCLELLQAALSAAGADQAEVFIYAPSSALTRFAESVIHQNVAERNAMVSVRAVLGRRIGCARGNQATAGEIVEVARRARALAEIAADDPGFVSLPSPGPIATANPFSESTASCTPEQRAGIARAIAEVAGRHGCRASGSISTDAVELAIANSLGIRAYARMTPAAVIVVVSQEGASGYAEWRGQDISQLDAISLAETATQKCLASRGAEAIEPGEYTVVLEPPAVGDLIGFLGYLGFGALSLQEGRSFLTDRIGKKVMGDNITIYDDPLDPRALPLAFDWEGVPAQKVMLIENGIARGVVYDSRTAAKEGKQSTGHATAAPSTHGPYPFHLFLAPGDAALQDMISATDRGILVTRFHYTNIVHEKQTIITGMTRDGTFLIERGKVTRPLNNLRFTQSIVEALSNVSMIGRDSALTESAHVPALKVESFAFTS